MGLKGRVMELLRSERHEELGALIAEEPRVARHLVGRLWDPDARLRGAAARGLGRVATAHPEKALEIARGLIWALRDEAAMHGRFGIAGLSEMAAANSELLQPLVGPLASMLWDEGLQDEILRALLHIADAAPEVVEPHLDLVRRYEDTYGPEERRLAALLRARLWGEHDAD